MNMKLRSRIIAGFSIAAFLMVSAACKQASNVETPKKPGTGGKTTLTLDATKVTVDSKNLTGSASPYSVELENGHKATLTADMVAFAEGAVTGFKDGDTVQTMLKVTVAGDKSTVSIELKDAAAQAKYTFEKVVINVTEKTAGGSTGTTALAFNATKVTVDSENLTGSASPYSVELENGHKASLDNSKVLLNGAVTGFKDSDTAETILKITVADNKDTVSIELKDAAAQAKYTFEKVVINVTEKTAGGSTGTTALAFNATKVTVDSKNLTGSASPYSVELENGHKATLTADMVVFAEGAVTGFKDGDTVQTMLKVTVAGDKSTVSIELKDAAAQAKYTFEKVVINVTEKAAQGGVSG